MSTELIPILTLPWWGYVLVALGFTHLTIIATTLYLHRSQAHMALTFHPAVSHLLRFWLWISTGQVTREWIAVHRKHHARVETHEDPHSPKVHGIKKVLFAGALLYHRESRNQLTLNQFGVGAPNDWIERYVYTPLSWFGPITMLFINVGLFGVTAGLLIWITQILWIPIWAAGVINGVGHFSGYRNYETPDQSRNIVPWGILIGGEELHNNNHAFASSARFSIKPWEIDIGWVYVTWLQRVGLVQVRKTVPEFEIRNNANVIDHYTVDAVRGNRVQVMANFAMEVLRTVYKEELQRIDRSRPDERSLLKRARKLMIRDHKALDEQARRALESLLEKYPRLAQVYHMKQQLQELWHRAGGDVNRIKQDRPHERLREGLETWCKRAETSGIEALEAFSARLRGYRIAAT